MIGFKPVKKHPNRFTYLPRYYDPEAERRDDRRAELRGERAADADKEYTPGQYIRTQREAREARRRAEQSRNEGRNWVTLVIGAILVLVAWFMVPRILDAFATAQRQQSAPKTSWQEEFDPYAPITVVPNDYEE